MEITGRRSTLSARRISLSYSQRNTRLTYAILGQVDVPPATLMDDMRKMYDCELGSDVKLIAADGRAIFAHKVILATRSEAFRFLPSLNRTLSADTKTVSYKTGLYYLGE